MKLEADGRRVDGLETGGLKYGWTRNKIFGRKGGCGNR